MTQELYLKRFQEIVNRMVTLTAAKNSDYADPGDAFHNFKQIEILTKGRITAADGIVTRITDKITRISGLLSGRDQKVKSESLQDTVMDMAVYSIILYLVLEEKLEEESKPRE